MIRVDEEKFFDEVISIDDEGIESVEKILTHTVIREYEVVELPLEEGEEIFPQTIESLISTKRLMPNGDYYIINGNVEQYIRKIQESEIEDFKNQKFSSILFSADESLKSFQYQGLTFEYSGSSKSDLIATMQFMQQNPLHTQVWFALDNTYKLGEPDNILITSENITEFSNAFFNHAGAVFAWKETQKYYLSQSTTIEEVEAISTEYPQ